MKITILGSGTCVPSLLRASSAILVEDGNFRLLVDCGLGVMHRLLASGCEPKDIDAIFLTHFHPDHMAELISLLFSGKYSGTKARTKPLTLMGGQGLKAFYEKLLYAFGDGIDHGDGLILDELPMESPWRFPLHGLECETFPVNHQEASLAISIRSRGKKLVISGDTDACPKLSRFAEKADLFICECSLPEGMKVPGHLTPFLAGDLAEKAGVAHLVLTHLYPPCEDVDIAKQASVKFSGKITVAKDLMLFEL